MLTSQERQITAQAAHDWPKDFSGEVWLIDWPENWTEEDAADMCLVGALLERDASWADGG